MKLKKLLALTAAAIMIFSCAACGGKDAAEDTTSAETVTAEQIEDTLPAQTTAVEPSTEDAGTAADATTAPAGTEAASEAVSEETAKAPETVEEIVEFYKKAAEATDKTDPKTMTKMELTSLDGGKGAVGALVSALEGPGRKALERNSSEGDDVPGGFEKLTAADVTSATAKDDGKYTTVHITLKNQVDGMNGKTEEGSVGHGIGVLDGIQTAIDEIGGVDIDASNGSMTLTYNNAYIDVKIDNATGKIVSGKWHHTVNVAINNVVGKIGFIKATLDGGKVVIDYTVTM